mmetsp:Transcript_13003/g.34600  ORF Transcript_13003/g.34600 Transcript_13003/m.34600 type:complete len:81 (+) Transcript_13003:367-609(+)
MVVEIINMVVVTLCSSMINTHAHVKSEEEESEQQNLFPAPHAFINIHTTSSGMRSQAGEETTTSHQDACECSSSSHRHAA